MKLELKHIAPYLPFGLKILHFDNQRKMNAGNGSSTHWIGITATLQRQGENCKPILRPLSDLTKEIEVGGERFIPIDKLNELFGYSECRLVKYLNGGIGWRIDSSFSNTAITFTDMYYPIEKLFEWHFDVFGLIESGLSIDINTLSK